MTDTVPCLMLSLQDKTLLVPSEAVAEIIPFEEPKSIEESPDWLLGVLSWRGINIPLGYLEKMESYLTWSRGEIKHIEDKHKFFIAVINRIYKIDTQDQKTNQYPFFSIVLKNIPKLFRITKDGIKVVNKAKEGDPRYLMEIKIQNDRAFIPDLNALWKMIDSLPPRLQWFRQIVL